MVVVGRTKIPYNDLFSLNRRELKSLIKGHEIDQRELVEAMRTHAMIGLQPHLRKGTHLEPSRLWKLPWERNQESFISTEDDKARAKILLEMADKVRKN